MDLTTRWILSTKFAEIDRIIEKTATRREGNFLSAMAGCFFRIT